LPEWVGGQCDSKKKAAIGSIPTFGKNGVGGVEDVQDEWSGRLLARRPEIGQQLTRTKKLMDLHIPEGRVTGYSAYTAKITLPDPNDRHVLAAAVKCGAKLLLTENVKDFPESALTPFSLKACTTDSFLRELAETRPADLLDAVAEILNRLKNPPVTLEEYTARLTKIGLPNTSKMVREIDQLRGVSV